MTLRLRLVLGLLTLLAVGLVAFGLATGTLYSRSQYDGLDSQMRAGQQYTTQQLEHFAHPGRHYYPGNPAGQGPIPEGSPTRAPTLAAPPSGTYGLLVSSTDTVIAHTSYPKVLAKLPATLPKATATGKMLTVGATNGSGHYRVLVFSTPDANTVVMVTPTKSVVQSVQELVVIEAIGGALLLLLVCAGAWIVVRRELHPLERMASSARTITAGDLSQRVSTAGPPEVGQLGLALNTMLGDIESAFRDREATELRLRQFLADASHELRTPLTSIQGFAELFRVGGSQAQVDLPTILRRIEQESARMSVLVDDLLILARLDQARPIERQPVDLAVLAADTCTDLAALAPERTVTLDAPEPVVVQGDQHHLQQALANLAVNAVRHTPAGTPIEVSARQQGDQAVVSIRDHGPGLAAEDQAHVFDRFWQADTARVGAGVGLGLAIVAGIAAEHGGRAEVADAPGGGACFSLRLPASPA
jgi:two-component system, OmpR family, sensor kinase